MLLSFIYIACMYMLLHTGRYVLSRRFNLQSTRTQSLLLVVSELVVQVGELRDPSLFEAQPLQKNNTTCCASLVNITAASANRTRAERSALSVLFSSAPVYFAAFAIICERTQLSVSTVTSLWFDEFKKYIRRLCCKLTLRAADINAQSDGQSLLCLCWWLLSIE